MTWRVPLAVPDLSGKELDYVREAIESSWISSTGPFVERFEAEFALLCRTTHAIGVSNGTVGLHLLMVALGVEPGDEVIVPSLTYIATANAVRYVGAKPVFVDIDPETWCLDPEAVENAISSRTAGVIAVHLYGHPADMGRLAAIAARHGLFLVEDAAEAHGATYQGEPVGGLSTAAVFSFYGNKILTSGEGGAITTNDGELFDRIRLLRGQGMDPDRRYFFPVIGYNYRLTNVACAMLCAQIERLDVMLERRRAIERMYRVAIGDVDGIGLQPRAEWAGPVPWLVSITVDRPALGIDRDELMRILERSGIETRPFFVPIHTLPPYAREAEQGSLVVTETLSTKGMNLPTFVGLKDSDVAYVAAVVREVTAR